MNTNSESPHPWRGMSDREKAVWSVVYTRYADDPELAVMKANQAILGLKSQDLDGPLPEIWEEPSRKRVHMSFEDWKIWYSISFEIRHNGLPTPEQVAADFEAYGRGQADFW